MTTHRSMCLLAVVALVATGCSDNSSPTGPEAVQAVVTDGQAAGKPSRAPYISDLQLHSIYVDMGPDGTYDNAWDIVLTNPGSKATGLFLQSEIRQNQYTWTRAGPSSSVRHWTGPWRMARAGCSGPSRRRPSTWRSLPPSSR